MRIPSLSGTSSSVTSKAQVSLCRLAAVALAASLAACGGGGGGSSGPTGPTSLNDARVAILVAANMLEATPLRYRDNYLSAFTAPLPEFSQASFTRTGAFRNGTETITLVNLDAQPSAGDSITVDWVNYQSRHGSTTGPIGTFSERLNDTIQVITNPLTPATGTWTYSNRRTGSASGQYAGVVVGAQTFDLNYSGSYTESFTTQHQADGTQTDTTTLAATGSASSSLGASQVVVNSAYSCAYTNTVWSTCTLGNTTLTGQIFGLAINATMTQLPGSTPSYEIDAGGGLKWVVSQVTYSTSIDPISRQFSLRLPTGEVLTLTGEDMTWLKMGF